jgi:hypothetical protein
MTLIEQVGQILSNAGLGTMGANIFLGYMPETPDNCIGIFNTGGVQPSIDIPNKMPTFQVTVRNTNYETGETNLNTVRTRLHQFRNAELVSGQTYFYFIYLIAEGGHIGRDTNGRDMFSINFRCKTR